MSQVLLGLRDPGDHQVLLEVEVLQDDVDLWEEEDPPGLMDHQGVMGGKDCLAEQAVPGSLEKMENRDELIPKTTFAKFVRLCFETVYLS